MRTKKRRQTKKLVNRIVRLVRIAVLRQSRDADGPIGQVEREFRRSFAYKRLLHREINRVVSDVHWGYADIVDGRVVLLDPDDEKQAEKFLSLLRKM